VFISVEMIIPKLIPTQKKSEEYFRITTLYQSIHEGNSISKSKYTPTEL
jgi:hypothetical protein